MNCTRRIGATIALTVLTTAQAFALTFNTIAYTPPYNPQLRINCFTVFAFSPTFTKVVARECDSGERPGSYRYANTG